MQCLSRNAVCDPFNESSAAELGLQHAWSSLPDCRRLISLEALLWARRWHVCLLCSSESWQPASSCLEVQEAFDFLHTTSTSSQCGARDERSHPLATSPHHQAALGPALAFAVGAFWSTPVSLSGHKVSGRQKQVPRSPARLTFVTELTIRWSATLTFAPSHNVISQCCCL